MNDTSDARDQRKGPRTDLEYDAWLDEMVRRMPPMTRETVEQLHCLRAVLAQHGAA